MSCLRAVLASMMIGFAALSPSAVPAAEEGWQTVGPSQVRLVGAGRVDAAMLPDPLLLAGVEIRLAKGWKTYWRTPGDGIGPRFDWAGSRNVAAEQVLWPVPQYFRDAAGEYNGYKNGVIFPVLISPRDLGAPVRLELALEYAVCSDICVPVNATLSASVSADAPEAARKAVMAVVARTPVRADAQGHCPDGLAFGDMRARLGAQMPHLQIEIAHPQGLQPQDLFIEAADGAFLPHPKAQGEGDARRTVYRLDLGETGDPEGLAGQTLTLTAVGAQQSCEMALTVK
jgi:DsbC/DsbD-like thiol-disulfide interchange protein